MDFVVFISLLTIFSSITSICVECCKKILDNIKITYSSNILVFVVACIVGISGTCVYYVFNSIEFNLVNVICVVLMGVATSIGAMVGYDKVVQTIQQLKKKI